MNFLVHTVKIVHVSFSKCVFLFKLSRTMQSELFHVPEETQTYSLFTIFGSKLRKLFCRVEESGDMFTGGSGGRLGDRALRDMRQAPVGFTHHTQFTLL